MSLYRLAVLAAVAALPLACGGDPVVPEGPGTVRPPTGTAGKTVVDSTSGRIIADELLVRLAPGVVDREADGIAAAVGAHVSWRGPRTGVLVLQLADSSSLEPARAALGRDSRIAEVTYHRVAGGTGIGTTPSVIDQWNLYAAGLDPAAGWGDAAGVRVAVLDTGAAYEDRVDSTGQFALAPDLAATSFMGGYDFVNDDAYPNDDNGHGTHVTAIIAGAGPLAAVAPGATILPIKVLDADNLGTELGLAEGVLHAIDNGADVINLSLAFDPEFFPSRFLQRAVEEVTDSGAVIVASAGNHAGPVVSYPAAFRDVIAVAASQVDPDSERLLSDLTIGHFQRNALELADYSNRGVLVDISAPGGSGQLVREDGRGEGVLAQSFLGDPTEFAYFNYAGTSQAAAEVAGLAAIIRAQRPGAGPDQIRAVLGDTAAGAGLGPEGRGHVRAGLALQRAGRQGRIAVEDFFVFTGLSLASDGDGRGARAVVEVVDETGRPVRGITVVGTFTGAVYADGEAQTDEAGIATFEVGGLAGEGSLVAFQVDALVRGSGNVVERPHGLIRIDSCSLEMLADYAQQLEDLTLPGQSSGQGIGTTPSAPLGIYTEPQLADQVASVGLLHYSWSVSTLPMAVSADAAWYADAFEGADLSLIRAIDVGSLALSFTSASFALAVESSAADHCVDLQVRSTGDGRYAGDSASAPLRADPRGNCGGVTCAQVDAVLDGLWRGELDAYSPDLGIDEALYAHLVALVSSYAQFSSGDWSRPAAHYDSLLTAAGLGLAGQSP